MTESTGEFLVGYARVSTHEQSLEMQLQELEKAGVPRERVYTDVMSGGQMNRPGLRLMISHIRRGDVVVVWKLDRLGRSLRGVLDAVEELEKRGIRIRSITEPFDTTTPMGKMMMQIMLALAEMERNLIAERTRAGIKAYQERGGRMGPKHHVLHYPKRLKHFRMLYDSGRLEKMSAQQIIDELNAIDPKAPKIKRPQSFYNWRRTNYEGFDLTPDVPLAKCKPETGNDGKSGGND